MPHDGATLYVYFRVDASNEALLLTCFARQRLIVDGIACALSRRRERSPSDEAAGACTWMETYRFADADFDTVATSRRVDALAEQSGLSALALDGRHHEWFEPCA